MAGSYVQGASIRLLALGVMDITGALVTSPAAVKILILKSDGNLTTVTRGWINDGSGNFHYDLQTLSTDPTGLWSYEWDIENGTYWDMGQDSFTILPTLTAAT